MTGAAPADETGRTPHAIPAGASEFAGEDGRGAEVAILRGVYPVAARVPLGPVVFRSGTLDGSIRAAMPTGTIGNLGEAEALAWLTAQGYEVYVGMGNTSCDLIAMRPGRLPIRVEVKTSVAAKVSGRGTSRHRWYTVPVSKSDLYDMLIWVLPMEGILIVNPEMRYAVEWPDVH